MWWRSASLMRSGVDTTIRGLRQPISRAAALGVTSPLTTFSANSGSSRFSRATTRRLVSAFLLGRCLNVRVTHIKVLTCIYGG